MQQDLFSDTEPETAPPTRTERQERTDTEETDTLVYTCDECGKLATLPADHDAPDEAMRRRGWHIGRTVAVATNVCTSCDNQRIREAEQKMEREAACAELKVQPVSSPRRRRL